MIEVVLNPLLSLQQGSEQNIICPSTSYVVWTPAECRNQLHYDLYVLSDLWTEFCSRGWLHTVYIEIM